LGWGRRIGQWLEGKIQGGYRPTAATNKNGHKLLNSGGKLGGEKIVPTKLACAVKRKTVKKL